MHRLQPRNGPRTPRSAIGHSAAQRASAPSKSVPEPPFNYLEYPTDIVLLVVPWRLRYKLSLRDLAEMFLKRGFEFTHEAVRDWETRFAPLMAEQLRAKRRGQAGRVMATWTIRS